MGGAGGVLRSIHILWALIRIYQQNRHRKPVQSKIETAYVALVLCHGPAQQFLE
jgi:hypothetical protein